LRIEDRVVIGHGAAIAAYERVRIGVGTVIGPFAIIMDTNFHGAAGDQSVSHDCRPIVIGANCRLGSRVTVTRGVELGDGASVLAGSVVTSNIPAGMCAGGARARILGPASAPGASWDGAFGLLPVLTMETLGLDAPPDGLASLVDLARGDLALINRLADRIASHFGVAIDVPTLISKDQIEIIAADIEERRARS
jgi:hypothetical protein